MSQLSMPLAMMVAVTMIPIINRNIVINKANMIVVFLVSELDTIRC